MQERLARRIPAAIQRRLERLGFAETERSDTHIRMRRYAGER